ncbi:MAG: immune inhibitor A, partial [Candidatus Latescibacteria bacterium]|nr:immune inhibitor A [Candidatus Latescibacterota bacterium]
MKLLLAILVIVACPFTGIAEVAPFICGGTPQARKITEASTEPLPAEGHRSVFVIFGKFRGEAPADSTAPAYAQDFFNLDRPGSVTHFYNEMSFGRLQIDGVVLPKVYEANGVAGDYTTPNPKTGIGEFGRFNEEVLKKVDADVDFGDFDNDGPDGLPNSGDDDGYVDFIFINLRSVPTGFFIGTASGFAALGFQEDVITNDEGKNGGQIRIHGMATGQGGTTQRVTGFSDAVGSMAHEFGHTLGLPDLFDQSFLTNPGQNLEEDSAGVGGWDLMARGTLGWNGTG